MTRPRIAAKVSLGVALAFAALSATAEAQLAPPTASVITNPASPAYVTYDAANPGTLHVDGTTSGGGGPVDLLCYGGATQTQVATGVSVPNGAFSVDVPLTKALLDSIGVMHGYCVLRAVPAGTHPAAAPDQPSPFQG